MSDSWGECAKYGVATLACAPVLFAKIIQAALTFLGTVAVIMIIVAGYMYVTSGGDAKKAGTARSTITWAIIGMLFVLFSFLILNVIGEITGVTCLNSSNIALGNCERTQGPPPTQPTVPIGHSPTPEPPKKP